MRLTYIFFILGILAANTLVAQQTWSLNQCIAHAIKNNVNLKTFEIDEEIAAEAFSQSKRNMLPSVSASSNAGISFGRSVDPNTNDIVDTEFFNNSYSFGSSVTLFNGFRLQHRIQYEKFRKQALEYNRLNAVDDLAFRVMNAFFDARYYIGMLGLADEQVKTSKLNLKAIEKQVEVGRKSTSDLLEMRANLEMEELRRIQMENQVKSARLTLRQLMNLLSGPDPELESTPEVLIADDFSQTQNVFDEFTRWSPYYLAFVSNLKAVEKQLAISRSALYPSVAAHASMNTGYFETYKDKNNQVISFRDQLKNNKSQYLGLSVNLPIFTGWSNRSYIKMAKLALNHAQTRLEIERQKLYFEISENLNKLEALGKEYRQYERQKEVDALAYKAAERKFEQGLISVVDYYVAKNRYANSDSQLMRSRLQLEIQQKTIAFYTGKRFWEQ